MSIESTSREQHVCLNRVVYRTWTPLPLTHLIEAPSAPEFLVVDLPDVFLVDGEHMMRRSTPEVDRQDPFCLFPYLSQSDEEPALAQVAREHCYGKDSEIDFICVDQRRFERSVAKDVSKEETTKLTCVGDYLMFRSPLCLTDVRSKTRGQESEEATEHKLMSSY